MKPQLQKLAAKHVATGVADAHFEVKMFVSFPAASESRISVKTDSYKNVSQSIAVVRLTLAGKAI